MSLFRLVRQHRAESAQTEIGKIKASKRVKRFHALRFILIVLLIVFAIAIIVASLNNAFHWWTVMPWPNESEPTVSAPETSAAERIVLGFTTRR